MPSWLIPKETAEAPPSLASLQLQRWSFLLPEKEHALGKQLEAIA